MKNLMALALLIIMVSCNSTKNSAAKKEDSKTPVTLTESLQLKQQQGIDLYAKGSIPASWTLEMDYDKIIRFQSLDGADFRSSPVPPVENKTNGSVSYTSKATNGNMVISLFKEGCTDALSGEKFNQKITVEVDGKKYEGCGQYLFDAALNGKWILQNVIGNPVTAKEFAKGLPEISFNLAGNTISGHDGCNNFNGSITVMGNQIKFSAIGSTKMACPANNKDAEFISKISNQVATYYFKDGLLYLYLIDDSTLGFSRG